MNRVDAERCVEKIVEKVCIRFGKEFEGNSEELVDTALREFAIKSARISWKTAQKWCKWEDDGPVLFPDMTRIYYRKENTEIVLQEFKPQVRFVRFKASIAKRARQEDSVVGDSSAVYDYSLAFPYVIFIFKFSEGEFSDLKLAFNDRPLKYLDEQPLMPYLSNVNTDLTVCLGASLDKNKLETGNIFQQTSYIISHFWNSVHSDEWTKMFWKNRLHFLKEDKRLASLESWQEASSNPLFVIEDVDWIPYREANFGDIIVDMLGSDTSNISFSEEIYSELLKELESNIKSSLEKNVIIPEKFREQLVEEIMKDLGT